VTRGLITNDGHDRWEDDPLALSKARQLFFWQASFVDALLGRIVERLRDTGTYDRALLIITADHGVSIRPGDFRRRVSPTNSRDILGVPLLVKLPQQVQGKISDRNVESIDILPLIADVLGLEIPWAVDGASPLTGAERSFKAVFDRGAEQRFPADLMVAGSATDDAWQLLVPAVAHRLVGRNLEEFVIEASPVEAVMSFPQIYANVVPEVFVPCIITGRLPFGEQRDFAVSVNGRIATVTSSYPVEGGSEFSATVDERAFRIGANSVEVLLIGELPRGLGSARSLQPGIDPLLLRVFKN